MPNSNKGRRSFFKRIADSVKETFAKIITPRAEQVPKPKKKSSVRSFVGKMFGGSEAPRPVKPIKYSSRKPYEPRPYKNKSGVEINDKRLQEIKKIIQDYNREQEAYRKKIIERAKEVFDPIIADNMEMSIERAVSRDKRRFDGNMFESLRDMDEDEILGRITDITDIDEFIDTLNNKQTMEEKASMYQENYVKALFNEYGETTITLELAELIKSLDRDVFMMSYYNTYSDTHLKDIYDTKGQEGYLNMLTDYFDNLKEKEQDLLLI